MKRNILLVVSLLFLLTMYGCSEKNGSEKTASNNPVAYGTVTPRPQKVAEHSDNSYNLESTKPAFSGKASNTSSATITTTPEPKTTNPPEPTPEVSMEYRNALSAAHSYLNFTAFSYTGLIEQLEYEGYSSEACVYAVDNCGADWNAQALTSARDYLDFSAFSYSGLIEQLEYEGFTSEQSTYAVDNCGADWNEQAAKSAQEYLNYSSFSRQGLIDQLIYEGFTSEQAEYGVASVGY